MFKFLQATDAFEQMYNRLLAKRLLMKTTRELDLELQFVARLKTECGEQFTERVELIFKDIKISRALAAEF